ncbi:Uncharacterized protein Adt_20521 [Abeliophyllum distichum]|uniref:Putative plant transposon protein domain-containing protein n=1 Tax=Abeliophyllum distichum TaxID=126358 RepID=A0ABD1SWS1_9LAMI
MNKTLAFYNPFAIMMPRVKMPAKRSRRKNPPFPSSEEEASPENRIDNCSVLIGKNVDLASFTFEVSSFHLEDYFVAMGWVSILTLNEKAYPTIMKEFYKKIVFSPGTGISCLVRDKRMKITRELIYTILELEDGGIRLYTSKMILHLEEYNSAEACCCVTKKHFEALARLSTNQLTLTCRVLHNIISHIIVHQKGHLDEVNHYDVFLLDSILVGQKLDFTYIMLNHMDSVLRSTNPKALPYGMILAKIFQHFKVSFRNAITLLPKSTDTINALALKRMKFFKEDGQWVTKSKGFDDESRHSTLPFEGGEEMDENKDDPLSRLRSHRPSSSTSGFTFTEDHFNLLNGRIDLLISTMEGLHHTAEGLHHTMGTLQQLVDGDDITSSSTLIPS